MGNQNNIVKFGVPGFFWLFRYSGIPVFLVLVQVILLTIFDNA